MKKTTAKWAAQLTCGILLSLVGFYISRLFVHGGSMGMVMKKVMTFVTLGAVIGTIIGRILVEEKIRFNVLPIVASFILGGVGACFGLLFLIFIGGVISIALYLFVVIIFSSIGYDVGISLCEKRQFAYKEKEE